MICLNLTLELWQQDQCIKNRVTLFWITLSKGCEDRLTILQIPCHYWWLPSMPLLARCSSNYINVYIWSRTKMHAHQRSHKISATSNSLFKYNHLRLAAITQFLFRCWSWVVLAFVYFYFNASLDSYFTLSRNHAKFFR